MVERVIVSAFVLAVVGVLEIAIPAVRTAIRRRLYRKYRKMHPHVTVASVGGNGSGPLAERLAVRRAAARPACSAEAERLWQQACALVPHRHSRRSGKSGEYVKLLVRAARLGHTPAMLKLGERACRHGTYVEAYYWSALADLRGDRSAALHMRRIKARWVLKKFPEEKGNVWSDFSKRQAAFARALLRISCGIKALESKTRLREMADRGCEEAKLWLARQA